MSFAQSTYRKSLADLEVCLRSRRDQLYHMGFRSTVAHSPLADTIADVVNRPPKARRRGERGLMRAPGAVRQRPGS